MAEDAQRGWEKVPLKDQPHWSSGLVAHSRHANMFFRCNYYMYDAYCLILQTVKLPVLVACTYPPAIDRVFHAARSLVQRSLARVTATCALSHLVSGKSSISGIPCVEAGLLPMASGGVCCLGDIGTCINVA